MAKLLCSEPGCMNLRIDAHNSKCRYHMNEYMKEWRQRKRAERTLKDYLPFKGDTKNRSIEGKNK